MPKLFYLFVVLAAFAVSDIAIAQTCPNGSPTVNVDPGPTGEVGLYEVTERRLLRFYCARITFVNNTVTNRILIIKAHINARFAGAAQDFRVDVVDPANAANSRLCSIVSAGTENSVRESISCFVALPARTDDVPPTPATRVVTARFLQPRRQLASGDIRLQVFLRTGRAPLQLIDPQHR